MKTEVKLVAGKVTVLVTRVKHYLVKGSDETRTFLSVSPTIKVGNTYVVTDTLTSYSQTIVCDVNTTLSFLANTISYSKFINKKIVELTLSTDTSLVDEKGNSWVTVSDIKVLDVEYKDIRSPKATNEKNENIEKTVKNKKSSKTSEKLEDLIYF